MSLRVLDSLDDVLGAGADALVTTARGRGLLNGVAIGLVRDGACFVRLYGKGIRLQSRFELGSMTKTYTAELLALLVARGVVRLDDPVTTYLPGVAAAPGENAITFEDLATHRSGLPRLPPGLPQLGLDPYREYGAGELIGDLAKHGLERPAQPDFVYSNFGYSVLGYALGEAAGVGYAELLQTEFLGPLGMSETELAMGQDQPELMRGYKQSGIPAVHWNFDVCAACGALCSTVGDQLKWLQWLFEDPNRMSFEPRAEAGKGLIGLGWLMPKQSENRRHNGATAGFSSWISLNLQQKTGVVVLSNRQAPKLVDALGVQLERCLAGREAGRLGWDYGRGLALVRDPILLAAAPFSPLLSPVVALPWWLRLPAVAAIGYSLDRLMDFVSSGLRAVWLAR